jgi:hypothetical protein
MRSRAILTILFLSVMLTTGCGGNGVTPGGGGGGGNLTVGNIQGATVVLENSSVQFTIGASGDTGIRFAWAVDPAYAGSFTNQNASSTKFVANSVSGELTATVRVTINSDNYGPILKSLSITIRNQLVADWTRTWGGTGWDSSGGMFRDSAGNIYVTGVFMGNSTDLDGTFGTDFHTSRGGYDAYLAKYDSSGNFLWAQSWGGELWDQGSKVAADTSGNVYVVGYFQGTADFNPGSGYEWLSTHGDLDVYISKFSSSGSWQWTRTWGGPNWDKAYNVAVGSDGGVYVTGTFREEVDFDPGPGVIRYDGGVGRVFLSRFDSSGDLDWVRVWEALEGHGVAVDSSANVYVTGIYAGTADFDPGPGVSYHTSLYTDCYLSKLDAYGGYHWSRVWGGWYDHDNAQDLVIDHSGNIYVTGHFTGLTDFDPGSGTDYLESTDSGYGEPTRDVFVTKYDTYGNYVWARAFGGRLEDRGYAIGVDSPGNVYVTGYFVGTADFDPSGGIAEHTSNGGQDMFLTKLGASGSYKWTVTLGGTLDEAGWGVAVDGSGRVYATGLFRAVVDFDPSQALSERSSQGEADAFLTTIVQ